MDKVKKALKQAITMIKQLTCFTCEFTLLDHEKIEFNKEENLYFYYAFETSTYCNTELYNIKDELKKLEEAIEYLEHYEYFYS